MHGLNSQINMWINFWKGGDSVSYSFGYYDEWKYVKLNYRVLQ